MLGSFLEYSISVVSVQQEAQFYRSLGFEDLPTADFLPVPYIALWDGNVTLGLYERDAASPTLTFVRQDLATHTRTLRRCGMEFDEIRLGDDEFNQATGRDPDGLAIALVEARTFSPGPRDSSRVSACGEFIELSVPVQSVDESAQFWTGLGLAATAAADSRQSSARVTGSGLALGLHATRLAPGLSFVAADFAARCDYIRALGLELRQVATPALTRRRSAMLNSPSGLALYLHEAEEDRS